MSVRMSRDEKAFQRRIESAVKASLKDPTESIVIGNPMALSEDDDADDDDGDQGVCVCLCVCVYVCMCTLMCEIIFSEDSRQPAFEECSSEVHKEMDSIEPQSEHSHHKQTDQVIPGSKVCPGTLI